MLSTYYSAEIKVRYTVKFVGGAIGNINDTILNYPKTLEADITFFGEKGTARVRDLP